MTDLQGICGLNADPILLQASEYTAVITGTTATLLVSIIIIVHCGAKKLHRFIFAITFSNQAIF